MLPSTSGDFIYINVATHHVGFFEVAEFLECRPDMIRKSSSVWPDIKSAPVFWADDFMTVDPTSHI